MSGGSAEIAAQPTRKDERRLRHAMDEPAEMLHVALAGRGEHGAGAEEQQALEQRMIEDVQQGGGERERRREQHAVRLEGEREAEPDEDDADVLHRVIGEQPLEIVLHQRIEHAHHAVMPASASTTMLHHQAGGPARSNTMRTKP